MSLDDYELEERLRTHLHQQADAIHFENAFEPFRRRRSARGGLTLVAAAAFVIVAGLGFAAANGIFERSGTTEVATVPDNQAETAEVSEQDSAPIGNDQEGVAEGVADLSAEAKSFNVIDITNESIPNGYSGYRVDDGVYIVLSTAPGRVGPPPSDSIEDIEAYNQQLIPRTFYTLDTSAEDQGDGNGYIWQHNTVEERYISGFEVSDGLLYAVSTGLTTGELAPAVGTSPDHGVSWTWNDIPELSKADALAIDRSGNDTGVGDQLLIAGFQSSPVDPDAAIKLALEAGLEIDPVNFVVGTYDFVEFFPPSADAMLPDMGDIVRVRWADLGITPPESWRPWAGVYRYNDDGTVTELRSIDADQASLFLALNRTPWGSDYNISFELWPERYDLTASALELTESLTWNPINSPFTSASGSAGPYQFTTNPQSNTLPKLVRRVDNGNAEAVTAEDLVPGEDVVTGASLTVDDSRYGLFVDFNAYNGASQVVATPNGDDWQVINAEFEYFSVFDGDGEVLLIGNRWRDLGDGSIRQEGYAYRLTPGGS